MFRKVNSCEAQLSTAALIAVPTMGEMLVNGKIFEERTFVFYLQPLFSCIEEDRHEQKRR